MLLRKKKINARILAPPIVWYSLREKKSFLFSSKKKREKRRKRRRRRKGSQWGGKQEEDEDEEDDDEEDGKGREEWEGIKVSSFFVHKVPLMRILLQFSQWKGVSGGSWIKRNIGMGANGGGGLRSVLASERLKRERKRYAIGLSICLVLACAMAHGKAWLRNMLASFRSNNSSTSYLGLFEAIFECFLSLSFFLFPSLIQVNSVH